MARRITGTSVTKGDLVIPRQLYFSFDTRFQWIAGELVDPYDYRRNMGGGLEGGVGIVISTLSRYDRSLIGNDCRVFWARSQTITQESSQCLKVISSIDSSNSS